MRQEKGQEKTVEMIEKFAAISLKLSKKRRLNCVGSIADFFREGGDDSFRDGV